jgi:hypothetical protein
MFKKFSKYFWPGLVSTILLTTLAIWFYSESNNPTLATGEELGLTIESCLVGSCDTTV